MFILETQIQSPSDYLPIIVSSVIIVLLLLGSALISGSEVAFFSLKPIDIESLEKEQSGYAKTTLDLLNKPKRLLATILIANNFINVGIIVLSSYLSEKLSEKFHLESSLKLIIDVVAITFVILLFGEVIPKVYATKNGIKMTKLMAKPLLNFSKVFPFSILIKGLVSGTLLINKWSKKKSIDISSDDLEHAIELTKEDSDTNESHKILAGIVKFGSKDVKQIMKPRMDITAFDVSTPYHELYDHILESGYSRLPIYEGSFDNVVGILFVKDLIPYINETEVDWNQLLRPVYFIPETKKIDDLFKSFQDKKMHMAIVVDEFGGTSGLVTLEDVLEEIVGDISDEFDTEELSYSKLDDFTYVFEGKTLLVDFYKVLDIEGDDFEAEKGDSDTLAGFIIEQAGKILLKNERLTFNQYTFVVESADKRKIKRIKCTIKPDKSENNDHE